MKTIVQKLPKSQVKITIEVEPERVQKFMEKAAQQISQNFKIPGFRAGHVPLEILKQHVKEEGIEAQMMGLALPETYTEAVMKEGLKVVSRPQIDIKNKNPLVYEATVAIYPEVEVKGYEKIKVKPEEIKVADKDVDSVLEDIRARRTGYKEVDRAAKKGDRIEIDFAGFDEGGAPLDNTSSKNHPLIIGGNTLIPGFEDELIGLKKDDKKEFKITFPKDYQHQPFQNKKVLFKVSVHMVEEGTVPEMDAAFVEQIVGPGKSLDEVKKMIKENLALDRQQNEKTRQENVFLDKIIEHTKLDVPEQLIEEEIDMMLQEFDNELQTQLRINLQQFMEQNKKEIKEMRTERRKEAEKRLTLRFGLQKLFELEKIEINGKALSDELETIVTLYPAAEQQKIRQEYKEGGYPLRRLENKMKMDRLFARFLAPVVA